MGCALRCPPLPMWLFITIPIRRGSCFALPRLRYSTRAEKTAALAIWPLTSRVSTSVAPR